MFYVMKCKDNGHQFDVKMTIKQFEEWQEGTLKDDKVLPKCPECKSVHLDNIITTVPVHFSGTGINRRIR